MPHIRTTYAIDDKLKGARPEDGSPWRRIVTMPEHSTPEQAEAYYERLRDENPEVPLRLVSITEHEARSGRGKVYL